MKRIFPSIKPPLIIGIITRNNYHQVLDCSKYLNIQDDLQVCDILEFRADTFPLGGALQALRGLNHARKVLPVLGLSPKSLLFTLRLPVDGGGWLSSPEKRWYFIYKAIQEDLIDIVDIEIEHITNAPAYLKEALATGSKKLLVSHHNLHGSYSFINFKDLVSKIRPFSPDIIKFAVNARTEEELDSLLQFSIWLKSQWALSCAISIGRYGRMSRIGSPIVGAPIVYAFLGDTPTVKGQVCANHLYKLLYKARAGLSNVSGLAHLKRFLTNIDTL